MNRFPPSCDDAPFGELPYGSLVARANGPFEGHIPFFHSLLCQWPVAIPHSFLWVVRLQPEDESNLLSQISQVGRTSQRTSNGDQWNIDPRISEVWNTTVQQTKGCIFAQGVDIPGEVLNIDRAGIAANQGFYKIPHTANRADLNNVTITMLETNSSFADFFLRPWLLTAAHKGLFAYQQSIKATIEAYLLAVTGRNSPPVVRKRVTFYNAVPVSIDNQRIEYKDDTIGMRQTEFVFSSYSIDAA